ncbi:hypothetical protein ACTFIW_007501 [Dictyostelium discoideum]
MTEQVYSHIINCDNKVKENREKYGSNTLPPVEIESFFRYAEWFEGVGIASAVFLATFVSTYSEYKNENSFQELQEKASRVKCNVFRNGSHISEVYGFDVVVGDLVLLQAGDKIPADDKWPQKTMNQSQTISLDHYLCFRGTVVEDGEGVLLVSAVGSSTLYGELAIETFQKLR